MKKEHKIFFRGVPKSIRKLLGHRDMPKAIMDYTIKKPRIIRVGNIDYIYDSI